MFAHLGPVAGPNHFTDVIPWLERNPNTPPPQFLSDNYSVNGNLEDGPQYVDRGAMARPTLL